MQGYQGSGHGEFMPMCTDVLFRRFVFTLLCCAKIHDDRQILAASALA